MSTRGRRDEGGIDLRLVCAYTLDDRDGVFIERIIARSLTAAHKLGQHSSQGTARASASNRMSRPFTSLAACRHLVVHATEVRTIAGVDLDFGIRLNEQGHLNLHTSLERRRFGSPRRAISLDARLGVREHQLD